MSERARLLKEKNKLFNEINILKKIQYDVNGAKAEKIYNLIKTKVFQYKLLCERIKNEGQGSV